MRATQGTGVSISTIRLFAASVSVSCCLAVFGESNASDLPSPSSFSELRRHIVIELTNEGCLIPPGRIDGKIVAKNVISGEFARKGQKDWAILCFKDDHAYIRVFWGGAARCADRIEHPTVGLNAKSIEQWGGYDLAISPVGRKYILDHYRYGGYEGPKPPVITHQGIDNAVLEKTSTIHYCHNGSWLELSGAD